MSVGRLPWCSSSGFDLLLVGGGQYVFDLRLLLLTIFTHLDLNRGKITYPILNSVGRDYNL